jgi:hypothetical protein
MNYKQGIILLLLAVSLGCHAGVKKRLKKFFSCFFASQAVAESNNSSDNSSLDNDSFDNDFSDSREFVCLSEKGALNYSGWNPELFRKTGILPEDIAKNPTHPDKAAYKRRILEAME